MDTLNSLLSHEATHLQRSVMRDLIKRTAQPGIIALSGGLPASEYLPSEALADCFTAVLKGQGGIADSDAGGDALQYRPPYPPLIAWITEAMQARGVDCDEEQIFLTNGNQQGLTILSRLFLDPGAPAVTEAITFTGIHQVTAGRGAEVRPTPVDLRDGIDLYALEAAFIAQPRPRLAVVIPDFHNPLGVSISEEKRRRIAELSARYNVPLVEDDPYSALRFSGEPLPPIKAFDRADSVFYLGSFSKMLAPAARLGWMVASKALMPRLTVIRESIDLESSALMQRAVAEFLRRDLLPAHLERLNAVSRERRDALLDALTRYMGDIAEWTKPDGGLFVWVTLHDEQADTWQLFDAALENGVAFVPGEAFAIAGGYRNTMRLNFSKVNVQDIDEGVRRLAQTIRVPTP